MAQPQKKIKRKRWYSILPTGNFRVREIGESYTSEPSLLVGKTISVNAMDLVRDPRKQNVKITFKIIEVKDNKAITQINKYQLVPNMIKRMVHQGKSKLDSSFKSETKDKVKVVIKPVIITRSKTVNSVLTSLRKQSEKFIKEMIMKQDFEDFVSLLLENRIQSQLRDNLKKIYPLAGCHIRVFERYNVQKQ